MGGRCSSPTLSIASSTTSGGFKKSPHQGGCMRDNLASPPHHAHHYSGDAGPSGCQSQAGPSGMQLKRSSSRPCNVPGCTQCGPCARQRPQEHTMVYREDTLVSGALEALIRHAIPTPDYFPEDAYLFAFLLCSRLFAPLNDVLVRVIRAMDRCKDERRSSMLARNVLRFLREWTDNFAYDFREESMMALCIDITQRLVELLPACRREVSELQTDLLAKLTAVETYEEFLNRCGSVRYVESVEELTATDVMDMVRTPTKLAHQLTHVELERLSHIGAEEFVLAFMKERGVSTTGDDGSGAPLKKTRSKEAYEDWFTRLSYLVATEICKHPKKKQRLRVLDFWVQTARECYNIGNFNSLMAINAGLSLAPVARLKKTWSKVHCVKCFTVLQNLMSMSDNYKSYRTTLAAAVKRSKQQNVAAQVPGAHQPPEASNDYIVVPFFYLLVKDLHFLNVGCADRLPNGHVNFEKFWQLAKQVTEFIAWKQAVCPFPKNTDVIMYLQTSPLLTDNALALASFECEAPDNGPEKEHYKSLKK
ncbi:ras-GEF domain-containing family member 1B-like isoform X2 [Thrips palmi]|uniref:Ras-GEF domain-containing family member 1B-like isoform X2 n=1 Tax=Thrips palmi TaxID=161013 RepID=A0A6P8YYG2_THRPL|nr:ras-GEF domain-containing family member 1B-like isoform X2 [Thrips palmi]